MIILRLRVVIVKGKLNWIFSELTWRLFFGFLILKNECVCFISLFITVYCYLFVYFIVLHHPFIFCV